MKKLNVDCLKLIFIELNDKNSLYSCLLVNRKWCNIVVPILWKKIPWCKSLRKGIGSKEKLFNTILTCLPSSSKQLLSDNGINLPSTVLSNTTLFNYIGFCKLIEDNIINEIIKEFDPENIKVNLLEQEIYKLFVSQCKNIEELRWKTSQPLPLFPEALSCFSQLYSLYVDTNFVNSNTLYKMAQVCKDLSNLIIENCPQEHPGLITLIDAQRNLKGVAILPNGNTNKVTCKELGKALARKSSTIDCFYLGLSIVGIISFLTSFINLKRLTISNDYNYENTSEEVKYLQQYLAISEFPDLECLYIYKLSCLKELAMLIEKTNGNISTVRIDPVNNSKAAKSVEIIIKAIVNNCPKIKTLSTRIVPKDFIHVKILLLNCRYLKYIRLSSFDFTADENDNIGDELLDILTKFSPNSLTMIDICGGWKYSIDALVQFFESCALDYFRFNHHHKSYITEDHEVIVNKYISNNK